MDGSAAADGACPSRGEACGDGGALSCRRDAARRRQDTGGRHVAALNGNDGVSLCIRGRIAVVDDWPFFQKLH